MFQREKGGLTVGEKSLPRTTKGGITGRLRSDCNE